MNEKNIIYKEIRGAVKEVDDSVEKVVSETDKVVAPYRQSVLKRFPVLFTLLVTFGVAATFFGFEQLIGRASWLTEHPVVILLLGVGTLVLTGTLYKKLG